MLKLLAYDYSNPQDQWSITLTYSPFSCQWIITCVYTDRNSRIVRKFHYGENLTPDTLAMFNQMVAAQRG